MKEIIAAVGAAIFFIKGVNVLTDQGKNFWFRLFRAVLWCSLSVMSAFSAWAVASYLCHTFA